MKNEDIFAEELKHLLLSRKRKGGTLFCLGRAEFKGDYSEDMRRYLSSETLGFVGKYSFCYIAEESTIDNLCFLDVSRGMRTTDNLIDILGFFYEKGRVVSYVIERYNKKNEGNG